MKNTLFVTSLLVSLLVTGCKNETYIVKSTLQVEQTFDVKHDNGKIVHLNPGSYPTDLDINSSRVKATLKTADKNPVVFKLLIPKSAIIPANGTLDLTPAQTGQPFQTSITAKTEVENGPLKKDRERCQITYNDTECYVTGNPPQPSCRPVTRTRWGYRPVEYYLRNYHREIQAVLTQTQAAEPSAKISGSRIDSERVYTDSGLCF